MSIETGEITGDGFLIDEDVDGDNNVDDDDDGEFTEFGFDRDAVRSFSGIGFLLAGHGADEIGFRRDDDDGDAFLLTVADVDVDATAIRGLIFVSLGIFFFIGPTYTFCVKSIISLLFGRFSSDSTFVFLEFVSGVCFLLFRSRFDLNIGAKFFSGEFLTFLTVMPFKLAISFSFDCFFGGASCK